MKRNLKFSFRANVDTIVAYEFYESKPKNLGERFLNELEECYKAIVLNHTTYKVVYKIYHQTVVKNSILLFCIVLTRKVLLLPLFSTLVETQRKNLDRNL